MTDRRLSAIAVHQKFPGTLLWVLPLTPNAVACYGMNWRRVSLLVGFYAICFFSFSFPLFPVNSWQKIQSSDGNDEPRCIKCDVMVGSLTFWIYSSWSKSCKSKTHFAIISSPWPSVSWWSQKSKAWASKSIDNDLGQPSHCKVKPFSVSHHIVRNTICTPGCQRGGES